MPGLDMGVGIVKTVAQHPPETKTRRSGFYRGFLVRAMSARTSNHMDSGHLSSSPKSGTEIITPESVTQRLL
jgi:hypothetical protein